MTLFFVFIAAAIIWTKKRICNSLFYLYLFYIANARIYLFIHIARQWIALCVCRLHKMNERTNERCIHHLAGDCSFALSPFQLKRFLYSLIFSYFTLFFVHSCQANICAIRSLVVWVCFVSVCLTLKLHPWCSANKSYFRISNTPDKLFHLTNDVTGKQKRCAKNTECTWLSDFR